MTRLKRIWQKIKEGKLRQVLSELAWIYGYGKRYRSAVTWYIFLGVLGTGMSLMASVLSKNIVDVVTGFHTGALAPAAVFYVSMQLARIGINAWTGRISAKIEVKVDQEIRAEVYDKIMEADWQAMSQYHSGDLLNRMDNDVASVSSSVLGWLPDLVTRLVQFLGALGIILYYDPTLAGLALLSAPVTLVVSRTLMGRMRQYSRQVREVSSQVMMFHEESFQNIQVIKSFGLGGLYSRKLRQVQEDYRQVKLAYNKFSVAASALMSLVGTAVSVACFGWGVYRLWGNYITYGTMILFLQMAGSLSASFGALVKLVPSAISAATAAGRIMAVTELPREDRSQDKEAWELLEENRADGIRVETRDLVFRYQDGDVVLDGANFYADPGEIVALVGPSGEGKTTMLRLLLGIVRPQAGYVAVTGQRTGQSLTASASTRPFFAYVPQGNTMFAGTVAENLRVMAQEAGEEDLWRVLDLACAGEFVRKLPQGLDTKLKEGGGSLSSGQVQRLSIARALLADAPVLLLDEATSALDVATERKVLRNVLQAQAHKTVIVTTHRPSVLNICNRVYQIANRRICTLTQEEIRQKIADF
ncbi:MAG: ABC transporter ATP-binding protein [Oscillospiraceae bacterium]